MEIRKWLVKPAASFAVCALGLTGIALATSTPANAGLNGPVEIDRLVTAGSNYEANLTAEVGFWTLRNIAAAGLSGPLDNDYGQEEVAPPGGWDNLSAPWTGQGLVSKTVGKLLMQFTNIGGNGKPFVDACSANVVTSANKSVITAAGHCFKMSALMGGNTGDWVATNAVFIPGFNGANLKRGQPIVDGVVKDPELDQPPGTDVAPYGVWAVTRAWMPYNWYYNASWILGSDVAMAVVDNPYDSRPIADVTGGQRIGFNQVSNPQTVYQFGYPTNNSRNWYGYKNNDGTKASNGAAPSDWRDYAGRTMMYAHGTSFQDDLTYGNSIPSAMSPGSSGGPWFKDFDPATGTGVQIGVTSRFSDMSGTFAPTGSWQMGPALVSQGFGPATQEMYQKAQAASTN
ncbi:hypothetical protein EGT67_16305 [Prescottella agglutinans]|uniref:Peptidase n=2 Tax=Prescottella agglutinans TaxID=1644129 RepID=A0A438BBS6_9NOCA|nr:hypothetical protein EGT67_16305 [Prescottella agglutinans]